jgi:glucose-1-phosphate thymidylyltransferase
MNKFIILSGGAGTRLHPLTKGVSKQLLPVFSKPMIYYPLSTAMLTDARDILIITTPEDSSNFLRLLDDGSQFGINLTYAIQPEPKGLAQAFLIAEQIGFLKEGEQCGLILGDNLFYGACLSQILHKAVNSTEVYREANIFGIKVNDPQRYGIAELNEAGECISIEEKPENPKSDICVTGLYIYPNDILEKAKKVEPSARGELEITSINQMYLEEGRINVNVLSRGSIWLDTGTFDSLSEASGFVEAIEKRSGCMISCPEEIAYQKGWIGNKKLLEIGNALSKSEYGQYLLKLAK